MLLVLCLTLAGASAHVQTPQPVHGTRPATLEIRGGHVLRGDGSPPSGPMSIFAKDGKLVTGPLAEPEVVLDATGCWVLPGLVNTHAHLHEEMGGIPLPHEYQLSLWLASGITTMRENGGNFRAAHRLRAQSERGEIAAPRILLYRGFGPVDSVEDAVRRVKSFKAGGVDGIKLWSNYSYRREHLAAILTTATEEGLRCTAHIGVGETNARDYSELGIRSLEHWYGIPDAALLGRQRFPPEFSYSNEVDRFRWAGRLWREADPVRLDGVLQLMVERGVAWSPTLAVYEASRDLVRAQNQPWFRDYLHPALEQFFRPNLDNHGSYFIGWTTTDEAYWRENYQLWFRALRRFAELGGTITTGEDAGYIYLLYGFGLVRELELQHEAGFQPLEVLCHATYHGAKVLGKENEFGRVLPGLGADLAVVRGNPLANLKVFYPTGCDSQVDGKSVPTGGVRYTIKDGWIYEGPTLLARAKELVAQARAKRDAMAETAPTGR